MTKLWVAGLLPTILSTNGTTIYSKPCTSGCGKQGNNYSWCYTDESKNWDYCSINGTTIYSKPCTSGCVQQGNNYAYCYTDESKNWDYCSISATASVDDNVGNGKVNSTTPNSQDNTYTTPHSTNATTSRPDGTTAGVYDIVGDKEVNSTTPNSQDNTYTTPRPTYATTSRISRPHDEETATTEGTADTSETNWPLVIAVCVICSFSLIIALYGVYFYCFGAERQTTTQNKAGNTPNDSSQGATNAGRLENAKQFAVGKDMHKVNEKGELSKKHHKIKDAKHRKNRENVTKLYETHLAIE